MSVKDIRSFLPKPNLTTYGETFWKVALNKANDWKMQWANTFITHGLPNECNTLYRIRHMIIPSNTFLQNRTRRKDTNLKCSYCRATEDTAHIFMMCPVVLQVWKAIHKLFTICIPTVKIEDVIIANYTTPLNSNKLKLIMTFTHITLHQLWCFRNKRKFENSKHTSQDIVNTIKFKIRDLIMYKYNMYKSQNKIQHFVASFGYKNKLYTFENDSLIFKKILQST